MRTIICFLFLFNMAFSQQKMTMSDKEYNVLKEKIKFYYSKNTDSSLVYANQMAKTNNYKHLAFAHAAMSALLQNNDEEKKSIEKYKHDLLLTKALRVFCRLLIIGIVFLLVKNIRDKKRAQKKIKVKICLA